MKWYMKWYQKLFRRSRKASAEEARAEELNYRVKLSELRRLAERMRKETERSRNEAYRLEISGDHSAALSKAAQAARSDKAYQTACATLLKCERAHAEAKSQIALVELMRGCEEITNTVIDQIDTEDAIRVQSSMQQTEIELEERQEQMEAFLEGFEPSIDPTIRSAAGEDALAEIMAAHAPAPTPPAVPAAPTPAAPTPAAAPAAPVPEAAPALPVEPADASAAQPAVEAPRAEWLRRKRLELSEMM